MLRTGIGAWVVGTELSVRFLWGEQMNNICKHRLHSVLPGCSCYICAKYLYKLICISFAN